MLPADKIQRIYQDIGDEGFRALVEAFYRRVEADPLLRAIFPADLSNGRERQYLFLRQFFGGPAEYSERHGHPMLRRRHFPFAITREARDHWLGHMLAAIDEVGIPEPHASLMREYFERFSLEMINRGDDAPKDTGSIPTIVDVGGRAPRGMQRKDLPVRDS
jgi:hemoglobin